jgi:hypothetical protein
VAKTLSLKKQKRNGGSREINIRAAGSVCPNQLYINHVMSAKQFFYNNKYMTKKHIFQVNKFSARIIMSVLTKFRLELVVLPCGYIC